jgi:hypothetical protein
MADPIFAPDWMRYKKPANEEEKTSSFLEGLLQGARGSVADIVGGFGKIISTIDPDQKEAARQLYEEFKGSPKQLEGMAKLGSVLGSFIPYAPLGAAELGAASFLGGGRLASSIIGGLMGGTTGALLGDPDLAAIDRIVNGGIGAVLGGGLGAALPVRRVGQVSAMKVADVETADVLKAHPSMARFAERALVGALSGGVIGGVWLEDDPDVLFSPAGAAAGLAISALGAAKGEQFAQIIKKYWDIAEQKALGGLGPILKPIASEAEQLRYKALADVNELLKIGAKFREDEREVLGKAIEGFVNASELDSEAARYARRIVETTANLRSKLIELGALDPERTPPDKFLQDVIDSVTGYLPRTYSPKQEDVIDLTGDVQKQAKKKVLEFVGASTKKRGVTKRLSDFLKNEKKNPYGLKPKDFNIGDTISDGKHTWTVIKSTTAKQGKILWRDYTYEEMEKLGRNWDILHGLARLGQEHAKILSEAKLFKTIAENPELAIKDAAKAKELGWAQVKNEYLPGGFRAHGKLNGMWVRPDVAEALKNYRAVRTPSSGPVINALRNFNNTFKKVYLGYNEASYRNAFLGNMALSYMHGYNPISIIANGIKSVRDPAFRKMLEEVGITIDSHGMDIARKIRIPKKRGFIPDSLNLAAYLEKLSNAGINMYAGIDKLFKAGLIKRLIDKGAPLEKAVAEANRVFITSELLPHKIQFLRDTAMPFISFYYRFLENTLPTLAANPHRLLAVMGLVDALQMAGFIDSYGEKKWRKGKEYEKKVAPDWKKPMPGGMFAEYIRTPWGMFSTSFLPTNLPISMASNEQLPPAIALVLQNPVFQFAYSLISGRDPSTDAPITATKALLKTLPSPLPRKAWHVMAQKDMLPDPLIMWYNTTGSHPDSTPIQTWEAVWDAFLPTIQRVLPDYDYERKIAKIMATMKDEMNVRKARARRSTAPSYKKIMQKEVVDIKKEKQKEIDEILRLRKEVRRGIK